MKKVFVYFLALVLTFSTATTAFAEIKITQDGVKYVDSDSRFSITIPNNFTYYDEIDEISKKFVPNLQFILGHKVYDGFNIYHNKEYYGKDLEYFKKNFVKSKKNTEYLSYDNCSEMTINGNFFIVYRNLNSSVLYEFYTVNNGYLLSFEFHNNSKYGYIDSYINKIANEILETYEVLPTSIEQLTEKYLSKVDNKAQARNETTEEQGESVGYLIIVLLLFAFIIIFANCKKEDDTSIPKNIEKSEEEESSKKEEINNNEGIKEKTYSKGKVFLIYFGCLLIGSALNVAVAKTIPILGLGFQIGSIYLAMSISKSYKESFNDEENKPDEENDKKIVPIVNNESLLVDTIYNNDNSGELNELEEITVEKEEFKPKKVKVKKRK